MSVQTIFNRYEKKYLLTKWQYKALRQCLLPYMRVDCYGLHTICNLYYDTDDDLLIRRSLEKPAYKEKLRLRSYGIPNANSTVFLEIKKKYQGVVNKRRIALPLHEAETFLTERRRPTAADPQILREIECLLERYSLKGRIFLAYDRIAMQGREDPEFRLTFDQNIRSRRMSLHLNRGDQGKALFSEKLYLAESKISGAAPLWFAKILADLSIYPQSFSKYGRIYQKELGETRLSRSEAGKAVLPERKERRRAC